MSKRFIFLLIPCSLSHLSQQPFAFLKTHGNDFISTVFMKNMVTPISSISPPLPHQHLLYHLLLYPSVPYT